MFVAFFECGHEDNQGIDPVYGHGVVEGSSTTNRIRSLHRREEVEKAGRGSLINKLLFQFFVFTNPERYVHARTIARFDIIDIEAASGVNIVVEKCGALDSILLHHRNATLIEHVGDVETADIDGPA